MDNSARSRNGAWHRPLSAEYGSGTGAVDSPTRSVTVPGTGFWRGGLGRTSGLWIERHTLVTSFGEGARLDGPRAAGTGPDGRLARPGGARGGCRTGRRRACARRRDRRVRGCLEACRPQALDQRREIVDDEARMRLARRRELLLDADVQLLRPGAGTSSRRAPAAPPACGAPRARAARRRTRAPAPRSPAAPRPGRGRSRGCSQAEVLPSTRVSAPRLENTLISGYQRLAADAAAPAHRPRTAHARHLADARLRDRPFARRARDRADRRS